MYTTTQRTRKYAADGNDYDNSGGKDNNESTGHMNE